MATSENNLVAQIVKQGFGDDAKLIINLLIKKKLCSFEIICKELNLNKKKV